MAQVQCDEWKVGDVYSTNKDWTGKYDRKTGPWKVVEVQERGVVVVLTYRPDFKVNGGHKHLADWERLELMQVERLGNYL